MKFSFSFSSTSSTLTLIGAFFFVCGFTINNNIVVSFIAYQPTRPLKASLVGVVLFGDVKNEIVIDATPVANGFDTSSTGSENRREDKGSSSKSGTAKKMDKPFFVSIKPPNFGGGSLKNSKNDNNGEEEMSEDELEQRLDKVSMMEKELEQRLSFLSQLEERLASLNRRSNKLIEEQRRAAAPIDRPPTTTTASRVTDPAATSSTTRSNIMTEPNRPTSTDRPFTSTSSSGSTSQSSTNGRDSPFTTSTDQQSLQDRSYSSINPIARSSDIVRSSSFDTNYIWNNNATVQNIKSIDKIWEALTPTTVRAGSQRTWVYENPAFERVLILLKTNDGNPLEADIKVQQGPSNISPPLYMKVYGEDGSKRTFSAFLDTPQSPNTVTIKNIGGQRPQDLYTFVGPDKKAGDACLTTIRQKGVPKEILGGALLTYPIDSIVNSVAVLLKSKEGTPLNARIELLQGPINNNTQIMKQVLEVYTEDVIDHPLLVVIQTPGSDNTVQIVNTSPFPLRSTLVEYEVQRPIILSLLPLLLLVDFGIVASLFWSG